jgi:hypothetical protein
MGRMLTSIYAAIPMLIFKPLSYLQFSPANIMSYVLIGVQWLVLQVATQW